MHGGDSKRVGSYFCAALHGPSGCLVMALTSKAEVSAEVNTLQLMSEISCTSSTRSRWVRKVKARAPEMLLLKFSSTEPEREIPTYGQN